MHTEFDHLVVAADSLEHGIAHVEQALGVRCTPGGRHPRMGTHNALLRLGPARYLEVIAIDPEATPPETPRWFGLDDPAVQAALAARPRLLTWVARTDDLDATVAVAHHDTGAPRPMQRGALEWRIAFPDDGGLVEEGLIPPLIEWGGSAGHPARNLTESGLELQSLHGRHPDPARPRALLKPLGIDSALKLEPGEDAAPPHLWAMIRTPAGLRRLD